MKFYPWTVIAGLNDIAGRYVVPGRLLFVILYLVVNRMERMRLLLQQDIDKEEGKKGQGTHLSFVYH
jgi:hypothetical protein